MDSEMFVNSDEKSGGVTGFATNFENGRKFPLDMSTMAFSVQLYKDRVTNNKRARFQYEWEKNHLESEFASILIDSLDDMEPLAADCSAVYVWNVLTQNSVTDEMSVRNDRPGESKFIEALI